MLEELSGPLTESFELGPIGIPESEMDARWLAPMASGKIMRTAAVRKTRARNGNPSPRKRDDASHPARAACLQHAPDGRSRTCPPATRFSVMT